MDRDSESPQRSEATGLPPGLYERLVTRRISEMVATLGGRAKLDGLPPEDAPHVLARHVERAVERVLREVRATDDQQRLRLQVELCNRIIRLAGQPPGDPRAVDGDDVERAQLLLAILEEPPVAGGSGIAPERPATPLSQDALLVRAPNEPRLAGELQHEIASADRIDLICAFVVWSGVRVVLEQLSRARQRGVPLRILTTSYGGVTQPRALDALTALGADVRVSYDTRSTRLHAKAWLFERASGFSTAYVGSSNLSHAAIHDGLEWNVRLTQASSPALVERFRAAFETYWEDPHFEPYDRDRFAEAVRHERAKDDEGFVPFAIRPYPFQQWMLDRLDTERRRHGRWRNLLVAATGTGKTVVSAFDYGRVRTEWGGRARLLFVAHRKEILQQSRRIFRTVLADGTFGDLLVDGERPSDWTHVFASVQSLAGMDLGTIPADGWDMVIVDEFHHAEAPTYRRLLEHLRPRLLLGMTATPERGDERDVTRWFDGRIDVELRLWDAIEQGLLCPFQYFGVSDDVDLSGLQWRRGGYVTSELERLYTGDDARVAKILAEVRRVVLDDRQMRALGFCVGVDHAAYMARKFSEAGLPSVAVTGETTGPERAAALRRLRAGEINAIFSVDVFNEGLDIPEIDTVLMLRPTESATVFLQQLGRGLRFAEGKAGLTVLDFIGQQHRQFRFEPRFAALTGRTGSRLRQSVEDGFPYLPAGCTVNLDRVARRVVIHNLKAALGEGRARLVKELDETGAATLGDFLRLTERPLDDLYRPTVGGWTALLRSAGRHVAIGPEHGDLERAVGRLRHIQDEERVAFLSSALRRPVPPRADQLSIRERRLLTALCLLLWNGRKRFASLDEALAMLWRHGAIRDEIVQLIGVLGELATQVTQDGGLGPDIPLRVHGRYTRIEALAALGESTISAPKPLREGVYFARSLPADAFFVTLQKSADRFSPTTMYHDYAISPTRFHWETQSTTAERSPAGQRYIHHVGRGSHVLLFVREAPNAPSGGTMAFMYLGKAVYVRHRGERPMQIVWDLEHPMPASFFQAARAVA